MVIAVLFCSLFFFFFFLEDQLGVWIGGWGSVGILALCALRSTGSWLGSISPLYPLSLL